MNTFSDDRNRVVLSKTDENPNGYINASFISLPKGRTHFIAAQAPLTATLEEWLVHFFFALIVFFA